MVKSVDKWLALALSALALTAYLVWPTKVYYWDGIKFAQSIEDASEWGPELLENNHLLYRTLGYGVYAPLRAAGVSVRALEVLRLANSLLSALSVFLFFRIVHFALGSTHLAAVLSAVFSFSAVWWRFSTDANSYVPSVLLLLICLWMLQAAQPSRPVALGAIHCAAMLLHQLAVLFYPAALAGLYYQNRSQGRPGLRSLFQYTVVASALTLGMYAWAFSAVYGGFNLGEFATWVVRASPDASFSFDPGRNLFYSVRGHLRLFLGGRLSVLVETPDVFSLVLVVILLVLLAVLVAKLGRSAHVVGGLLAVARRNTARLRPLLALAAVWTLAYVVFLFFWLPHNTFYRLFYLPALLLLAGGLFAPEEGTHPRQRWSGALLAAVIALFNLTFYTLPATQAQANPPLAFALQMARVWNQRTVVYYARYETDNWTIRYFNPDTTWKTVNPGRLGELEKALKDIYASGGTAWFDTTASDVFLAGDAGLQEWLSQHTIQGSSYELEKAGTYRIRFVQIFPVREAH